MSEKNGQQTEAVVRQFSPAEHLIQIRNGQKMQDYLPVQWRLVWFRQLCPNGTIETELLHLDLERETEEEVSVWNNEKRRSEKVIKKSKGLAVFRAIIRDGKGGVATGTKSEKAASFPDFIEKAETGSIGRALAALGYGTQFAPELNESHRLVDTPVERRQPQSHATTNNETREAPTPTTNSDALPSQPISITEQQLSSIRKLYETLGKIEPQNLPSISFSNARQLIQQLTSEYKEKRSKQAS